MPRTPVIQVRTWIATLHGCQEDTDYDEWMRRCFEGGHCKYICGQLERGEDTGRLHLQFMVQFDRSKRLNGVRAAISEQAHWEPVHGSTVQCKAYVTKEATRVAGPWEYGALAAAGKRRGLDEAVDSVKAGVPLHEVAAEYSLAWVSHGKGLTSLRQMLKLDADRRSFGPEGPEVWVLWGPSGTGKSRWVAATWPDAFWKSPESKWWDGYSGQETVVLDDFKDYAMPLVELQRLLDWYPLWVEVKGGSVPMLAKRYVLTANTSPEDWYLKADAHRTIWRRVTDFAAKYGRLVHCVDGWTPPTPGAAGAEVPGNTEPQGQEPQPALGEDIVQAIADWRCD